MQVEDLIPWVRLQLAASDRWQRLISAHKHGREQAAKPRCVPKTRAKLESGHDSIELQLRLVHPRYRDSPGFAWRSIGWIPANITMAGEKGNHCAVEPGSGQSAGSAALVDHRLLQDSGRDWNADG